MRVRPIAGPEGAANARSRESLGHPSAPEPSAWTDFNPASPPHRWTASKSRVPPKPRDLLGPANPAERTGHGVCTGSPEVGCESDSECETTCDFSEGGLRLLNLSVTSDGAREESVCNSIAVRLRGFPDAVCSLPASYFRDRDPKAMCRLPNFGSFARPDWDCNGIDDTREGRCSPDGLTSCSTPKDCGGEPCITGGDLCRIYSEDDPFADRNHDGRGDECQCGDGNGDGAISGLDIAWTDRLEFHHRDPWARSQEHSLSNLALLCHAHNQHAADLDFGREWMQQHRVRTSTTTLPGES